MASPFFTPSRLSERMMPDTTQAKSPTQKRVFCQLCVDEHGQHTFDRRPVAEEARAILAPRWGFLQKQTHPFLQVPSAVLETRYTAIYRVFRFSPPLALSNTRRHTYFVPLIS